jgi:23S rRNA (pseudouridine1915-N3)-methyltransferase
VSVRVIALVDDERDPLVTLAKDYVARTGRRYGLTLHILKPKKRAASADDKRVKADEGALLLEKSEGTTRVALDAGGKTFTSEAFTERLETLLQRGRDVSFLVGGATGLSEAVKSTVAETWSLSSLTMPHKLALLVVCEQIYRAHEIARGGPYHK